MTIFTPFDDAQAAPVELIDPDEIARDRMTPPAHTLPTCKQHGIEFTDHQCCRRAAWLRQEITRRFQRRQYAQLAQVGRYGR